MNAVQRSQGGSATAKAAYRACCVIDCDREGRTHDYSRKGGLEASEIVLPKDAPEWAKDRAKLWNAVEERERNGKRGANANAYRANAQTARDYLFSLPDELSKDGRSNVARLIAGHLASTHGVAVDYNIHQPGKEGDHRNFHVHMMFTTRRMTAKGLGEKAREWDERKPGSDKASLAKQLRGLVAKTINQELAAEGKAELVFTEHQTFKERGIGRKAQTHQGPARMHMQRKQRDRERKEWFERTQRQQQERHAKELAGLRMRQDFASQTKQMELAQRGREAAREIKRELDRQRAADRAPDRLRRAFLLVTGRLGRDAFDRQTRDAQRRAEARQKLDDLKRTLRAERSAYATAQTKERTALTDRHSAEDRQLRQALRSRESFDRSADQVQNRQQRLGQEQEQTIQQERGRGRTRDEFAPQ